MHDPESPANVGAANLKGIEQDWQHLPPAAHGKGLEIVLQAHTLAGFPRTINALIKIHELGLHPEGTKHFDEHHDLDSWKADGSQTLHTVYGPISSKMRSNFRAMHPLLESILVEHIYGRILSRPLVGLRMRELCTLAIIAGQNLPLQMVPPPHFSMPSSSPTAIAAPTAKAAATRSPRAHRTPRARGAVRTALTCVCARMRGRGVGGLA